MPTPYNYSGDNSLEIIFRLIKGKVDEIAGDIPTVDTIVTDDSTNPVSSAGIATYVKAAVAAISTFSFVIVSVLPASGESNHIYLVPKSSSKTGNVYDEYVWIDSKWELIGSTEIDLSGYVQKTDMHELTESEVTTIFNNSWV